MKIPRKKQSYEKKVLWSELIIEALRKRRVYTHIIKKIKNSNESTFHNEQKPKCDISDSDNVFER